MDQFYLYYVKVLNINISMVQEIFMNFLDFGKFY